MTPGMVVVVGKNDSSVQPGSKGVYIGDHPDSGLPLVLVAGRKVALLPDQFTGDGMDERRVPAKEKQQQVPRADRAVRVEQVKAQPVVPLLDAAAAAGKGQEEVVAAEMAMVKEQWNAGKATKLPTHLTTPEAREKRRQATAEYWQRVRSGEVERKDNGRKIAPVDPVAEAAKLLRKALADAARGGAPPLRLTALVEAVGAAEAVSE